MIDLERHCGRDDVQIAKALVAAGLAMGCKVSVNDGEEWTVKNSEDQDEILAALGSTGEDRVRFRSPISCENAATFFLVYGNGDASTICDFNDIELSRDIYSRVEPLIDQLSE